MKAQRFLPLLAILLVIVALAAVAYVAIAPIAVTGTVNDAVSGSPLAGVTVLSGKASAVSDAQGRYILPSAPRRGAVAISLDGFQPVQAAAQPASWSSREATLDVAMQPVVLDGIISDAETGQPVAGAAITVGEQAMVTVEDGAYRFLRVRRQAAIVAQADGYVERRTVYGGDASLAIALEQNAVTVRVLDAADGKPVADATLSSGSRRTEPAAGGQLVLRGVKLNSEIMAQAEGYVPQGALYRSGTALTISLAANTVAGQVRDQASGQAINGATITLQRGSDTRSATSNAAGAFQFQLVRNGTTVTAGTPDHASAVITYTGQPSLTFALRPDSLRGVVRDRFSGQPMAGISVTLTQPDVTRSVRSDDGGKWQATHVALGTLVSAGAAGHATEVITYTGQMSMELSLRPNTVRGVVRDGKTGQAVAGAEVSVGAVSTKTAADGAYALAGIPDGLPLVVNAAGFDRTPIAIGPFTALDVRLGPTSIRAIYIPFYLLTAPNRVRTLINFAERAGMNGIVVDIKADDGYIAYASALPLAKEIKAQFPGDMISLAEVLKLAKQRGLYVIARIVVFKDNLLADARPDLAVKDKRTGLAWDDCGNGSTLWADPFRREVVDYNAGIAEEAARMGFDEVQFDYIRFPPACIDGAPLAQASYAVTSTMETRIAAIETFLAEAQKRVKPLGVAIAVDTFGWTLYRDDDMFIGQRMENMAKYVDYISPMVYPSTWERGANGLDYVPAHPYEIVYQSVSFGINRLKGFPGVRFRPWLQDFNDYQGKKLPYGLPELDAQRRGSYDAGAPGWMLWNAGGEYTEETVARP